MIILRRWEKKNLSYVDGRGGTVLGSNLVDICGNIKIRMCNKKDNELQVITQG